MALPNSKNESARVIAMLFEESSRIRLAKACPKLSFSLVKGNAIGPEAKKHARIMLKGRSGTISVSCFFDLSFAKVLVSSALNKVEPIPETMAIDFMRELSNLHGGLIRTIMEAAGFSFGISLPLVTDRISQQGATGANLVAWSLRSSSGSIYFVSDSRFAAPEEIDKSTAKIETAVKQEVARSISKSGDVEFWD